ncbi:MAG: hypothetical protein NTW20_02105 [Rhodobacterales bacterium]|nr:hypothetical protein [Rhodobacterales bacterium]
MTPACGPIRLRFALQGDRAHVRATDVLAAMMTQFHDRPLALKFARPLVGPALLHCPAQPGGAVAGRAGEVSFSLTADPDTRASRRAADRTPALHLRVGPLDCFAFRPGTPLAARIAAIFDRLHPLQSERFLVRLITVFPGPERLGPVLWSRLTITNDRSRARLDLAGPAGRLATLEFHLTARNQTPSQAPALPQSTG